MLQLFILWKCGGLRVQDWSLLTEVCPECLKFKDSWNLHSSEQFSHMYNHIVLTSPILDAHSLCIYIPLHAISYIYTNITNSNPFILWQWYLWWCSNWSSSGFWKQEKNKATSSETHNLPTGGEPDSHQTWEPLQSLFIYQPHPAEVPSQTPLLGDLESRRKFMNWMVAMLWELCERRKGVTSLSDKRIVQTLCFL